MKLCNVCGRELKRKHPACNLRRVKGARKVRTGTRLVAAEIESTNLKVELANPEPVYELMVPLAEREQRLSNGNRMVQAPVRGVARIPAPTLSQGIAALGQSARDDILRRMQKQKEPRNV